jgi:transcriptional regulator with XRE-family HTH domain
MLGGMLRTNVARAIRHLRRRRQWRQSDLASASGISRQVISRVERGEALGSVALRVIARLTDALDASVDVMVKWRGEELDRLIDSAHASLVQACVGLFAARGWLTRVEVSFNHYGDRGRVDILAFHPPTRMLAVAEIKTALGDSQDTLGRLDVKARLGNVVAASVGWDSPSAVVPVLVLGESRSSRRLIAGHGALFERFNVRGRQAMAWLRLPTAGPAPTGLLWFADVPDSHPTGVTRVARVRTARSRP